MAYRLKLLIRAAMVHRNQQNFYPRIPIVVTELLLYDSLRSNSRMGFLHAKLVTVDGNLFFHFGFGVFVKIVRLMAGITVTG